MNNLSRRTWLAASLACGACRGLVADEPETDSSPITSLATRISWKTLGGEQFWADEFIHGGWRIQRNTFTSHYRLLDPDDFRAASGGYDECRTKFDSLLTAGKVAPMKPHAVILLHGLIRTRDSMTPLGDFLASKLDVEILSFSYPSTRSTVAEHAASFAKVIERLDGVERIDLVAHSLGNIVVRRWLHDAVASDDTMDSRLRRMVMLAPPNNGAQAARRMENNRVFRLITGKSGGDLAVAWEELQGTLVTPPGEFGILAGNGVKLNPIIDGDDDFCVGVEETKLAGAADFRVLPLDHSQLRSHPTVFDYTLEFLRNGWFVSRELRRPLT